MITNFAHCMGCKNIFNKKSEVFCESCKLRYKVKFINNDIKIKNNNQVLQTKNNKKKLMLDLLSTKSLNNINIEEIKINIESHAEKKVIELNKNINFFHDYGKPEIGNLLINTMETGADEFKEKLVEI